jgi:putative endonuclease
MGDTQAAGRDAERHAETALARLGLRHVARNYRCRAGEIDLIMRDGDCLVFVEVRYRSRNDFGDALASVDRHKQRRLILAAQHYLVRTGWNGPCRFDVIGLDRRYRTHWIRDAFSA